MITPENTKKPIIVIADNLPEDLKALVAFLEQSGFRVKIARNGESAIKCLEQFPQDLILVDVPTIRTLQEQLQAQNIHLQKENERLKQEVEDELAHYHEQVYDLVIERTRELTQRNKQLQQEIAEHKQVEQALRLSEQQYRLLAERVADGIGIFQEGKLVFVNQALASLFRYPTDHLFRIDPIELIREDYQEQGRQRIASARKKMSESSWQVPCMTNDGREIWVEARQRGIEWQGKPAFLVTVRDITEGKRQEIVIKEERNHLRRENITLRTTLQERYKFGTIIGKSSAMQKVYQAIAQAAASNANVIISGESGTGKDLVAQTIHHLSKRKAKAFVVVNCSAVPENLFEREFFGHRKGTFTGADQDKPGYFDWAHKGTLFLDEVGGIDGSGCHRRGPAGAVSEVEFVGRGQRSG
jgi:PAS domain S-box-containing protein